MQTQQQEKKSVRGPMPKGFGNGEPFRETIVGAPAYIVSRVSSSDSVWGKQPKQ